MRPPSLPRVTNIGTTVPPVRPLSVPVPMFKPLTGPHVGRPEALPVARREGELPGAQYVTPDPLWTSRWQNSATPMGQPRPWVTAVRWWLAGSVYQSLGPIDYYRIDMRFIDGHEHAYIVPRDVYLEFKHLTTSVGQFLHQKILGPGWTNKNRQCNYPNFPI